MPFAGQFDSLGLKFVAWPGQLTEAIPRSLGNCRQRAHDTGFSRQVPDFFGVIAMRRATVLRRRSFLEGLESRQVLSGLVGATLDETTGTLTITGDDASNQIAIYADDTAGDVIVAGGTDDDGETLINDTAEPATFTGVTSIVLDLAGGDDTAVVTNLDLSGDLTADLGDGDDQLVINGTVQDTDDDDDDEIDEDDDDDAASLIDLNGDDELVTGAVSIGGDVSVTGGDGSDSVIISNATIDGDVTVDGGTGRDLLSISAATIGGSLTANMGAGDDAVTVVSSDITGDVTVDDSEAFSRSRVTLSDVTVGGDVTLTLSDKADQVWLRDVTVGTETDGGIVSIDTAAGNDSVAIRGLTAAELTVQTGDGSDRVRVRDAEVTGAIDVDLGTGFGSVSVADSNAESLAITSTSTSRGVHARLSNVEAVDAALTLGGGNDLLAISGSDFDTLAADLGAGRDMLLLRANNVATTTTLDGGDGQDRLLKLKRNTLEGLTDTNFERKNGGGHA